MKYLITLLLICCFVSIVFNIKLYNDIKNIKETTDYLETAIETIAAIQTLPSTPDIVTTKPTKHHKPLILEDDSLEKRVHHLEYQTNKAESKLNDIERESSWASSDLYWLKQQQKENLKNSTTSINANILNP